jgi:integrase
MPVTIAAHGQQRGPRDAMPTLNSKTPTAAAQQPPDHTPRAQPPPPPHGPSPHGPVGGLDDTATGKALAGWFTDRWSSRAPSTFNRNLDAIRSAVGYGREQGWITTDPTRALRRRGRAQDRTRALTRADIEDLLNRDGLALREKPPWRMLYETAARAGEVLALAAAEAQLGGHPRAPPPITASRRHIASRRRVSLDVFDRYPVLSSHLYLHTAVRSGADAGDRREARAGGRGHLNLVGERREDLEQALRG